MPTWRTVGSLADEADAVPVSNLRARMLRHIRAVLEHDGQDKAAYLRDLLFGARLMERTLFHVEGVPKLRSARIG